MQMLQQITNEDIWYYWRSLFPEVKNEQDFMELLNYNSKFSKENISEFYVENLDGKQDEISSAFIEKELLNLKLRLVKRNSLYHAFIPILNQSWEKIHQLMEKVAEKNIIENSDEFLFQLIENLSARLLTISMRTLVLEINIMKQNHELAGNSKYDRYQYYMEKLWNDDEYITQFYNEYKHLYNLQKKCIDNYVKFCEEMISNTWLNRFDISRVLWNEKYNENIKIKKIDFDLGDLHKQGRAVSILHFTNGKKVVYKPRSLKMEKGFVEYVSFINSLFEQEQEKLYEMKLIDKGDYGFIEFIESYGCKSIQEIQRYYKKAGSLMAILHSLNAKDLHHENMIAHGDNPVIIDLEALFHCKLDYRKVNDNDDNPAFNISLNRLDDSVYAIGLLPMPVTNPYSSDEQNVDVSGFSGEEGQISPFKVYALKDRETDEICLVKTEYMIETQNNLPFINGKVALAADYQDMIVEGFSKTYRFILENQSAIRKSIPVWFEGAKGRIIYRPTYIYTKLMFTGYHPDFMRQRTHRYVLFHRLAYQMKRRESSFLQSEIFDMMMNDVPMFEIDIDTGVICNSRGEDINIEFENTPLEMVLFKIKNFSEENLYEQIEIITNAFGVKKVEEYRESCKTDSTWVKMRSKTVDSLALADRIGKYILKKADQGKLNGQADYCWMNFIPMGDESINYQYAPIEGDLYSGNTGIALFYLYLWKLTQKNEYLQAVDACMNSVIYKMKKIQETSSYLIGAYNGLSGYLYVFSKIYQETGDERYLDFLMYGLELLEKIYFRDNNYDIISGSAGAIKVLLSIEKNIKEENIKKLCEREIKLLVNHLLDHSIILEEDSVAWNSGKIDHIYIGYAHGSSGIEEALTSAYERFPDERIKDTIARSRRFIERQFDDKAQNWNTVKDRKGVSNAWCHGAPGILYNQLRQVEVFGWNSERRNDVERALNSSMKYGLGNNVCYCHGDIGNLELLSYAAGILKDDNLKKLCDATYGQLANSFEKYINGRTKLPYGLLLGLSGVGYSLLRNISDKVPSILQFD